MPTPLPIPPELKKLTQFIRRAEELDRDIQRPASRLVAYYCRQYAVKIGIGLSQSASATHCLGEILTSLEAEKVAMSVFSNEEARLICRNFAMEVFEKADAQDLAGKAGKGTAKVFYAAAVFLEMLQHFSSEGEGEGIEKTEAEVEEDKKRIYSKWKATEILKAIKEGRDIVPGGYQDNSKDANDEHAESVAAAPNNGEKDDFDMDLPPMAPTSSIAPPDYKPVNDKDTNHDKINEPTNQGTEADLYGPVSDPPPPPSYESTNRTIQNDTNEDVVPNPPIPPPPPSTAPPFQPRTTFSGNPHRNKKSSKQKIPNEVMADVLELARFGIAALEAKDAHLGASRLQQALDILNRQQP